MNCTCEPTYSFSDFRIEDIKGALAYDELLDLDEKAPEVVSKLRRLVVDYRKKYSWRGPVSADYEDALSASRLQDLLAQGGDAARIAALLSSQKEHLKGDYRRIVMKCETPGFQIVISRESIQWIFDKWQTPLVAKEVLEQVLALVVSTLDVADVTSFGIQFRHVFRLKAPGMNVQLFGKTLLPGMDAQSGIFSAFGDDIDWRRSDLAWVFYRRNGELLSRIQLESPGNDNNSTVWLTVDTQTTEQSVDIKELSNLQYHFCYYEKIVTALLCDVLAGDVLDATRREMMVDDWFTRHPTAQ